MYAETRDASRPVGAEQTSAGLDPARRGDLIAACRETVISRLSTAIGEALDRMGEDLTALAMKEPEREAQQVLLDAVSMVRVHRGDLEFRFRVAFADVFERRMLGLRSALAAPVEAGELSLVGDQDVDDRIALERLAHKAQGKLDPQQVLGMRARLGVLADRDWFGESEHPAAPEAVFEALRTALDQVGARTEVRSTLMQALEPHVSGSLNGVYTDVNERLKGEQVLPQLRPRVVASASPQRASAGASAPAPDAREPVGPPQGPRGAGAPAGDAPWATFAPSPTPGGAADAFGELVRQIAAGHPSARRSAARMLADPETFGMADLPMPSVEPPLIEALNALQSAPPPVGGGTGAGAGGGSGAGTGAGSDAGAGADSALLATLLEQAREKGSSLDQLTVEIVSLVFDYIYNDRRLPDLVKQQLLRLQVVAVKAALLDRSFFARRQHPMRRLIDRICDMATDPEADASAGSGLVAGVTGTVDWIIERFDSDLATFEEALQRLGDLADQEATRRADQLAEVARKAEREEALVAAREAAQAEIAQRVDAVTPAFVREFLANWWTRSLAVARVDGAGSEWNDAMHACELLIWSVAPKQPEDVPRLASLLPRLIKGLSSGLASVGIEPAERERFFNELMRWHTRAIKDAKLNAARPKPASLPAVQLAPDGSIRFEARAGAADTAPAASADAGTPATVPTRAEAQVDALRRGELVDIVEPDGVRRTLRLTWISPTGRLYVLTRFPDVGFSLGRRELAAMFESGRASLPDPVSELDRAIGAIAAAETA